jgi:acyl-CoA synthetase (AMP-forming)/AMP-acid ligase II
MAETLKELLRERVQESSQALFLIFDNRRYSYGGFAAEAHRVAHSLLRLGVRKGDKIALLLPNCPEFLLAVFAAAEIGAIFVPVNTLLTAEEAGYVVDHSESALLITARSFLPLVERIRGDCRHLRHVVCLQAEKGAEVMDWDEFLFRSSMAAPEIPVDAGEIASITYTSGTTGKPKGVMLTQLAYALAPRKRAEGLGWNETDRAFVVLPLFHVNALCHSTIAMISVGGSVLLRGRFSATHFWDDVREHQVTTSSLMRTIPNILLNLPARPDDARNPLRLVVSLLPPELHLRFEERFDAAVVSTYSLTEDLLSVISPLDKSRRKLGSCGLPTAPEIHRLRILGEDGRECPPCQLGEITKRSPAVMAGYYKNPLATAEALKKGWLYTGDLGYVDEDGFLYFIDRKKDVIKRGDENISSEEVEQLLNSHPLIAESAVIGVPDPIRQEEVKACIVLKPPADHQTLPPEELWSFCAERLAAFKVPRYIEYCDSLPKTPSSKIQKNLLREETRAAVKILFDRTTAEKS